MSDDRQNEKEKKRPTHRVAFSRINTDHKGRETLGPAREIGAIWPREGRDGKEAGGILRFNHTPQEQGVYFVREIGERDNDVEDRGPRNRSRDQERERE